MKRTDLEHVIRAAAAISGEHEFVVLGASSLLATVPDPPAPLLRTRDVDLYPLRAPELAAVIDGSIGELSPFHEHFSYYAQGVGPETSILPQGWQSRRAAALLGFSRSRMLVFASPPTEASAPK
jgi:hypothetical protein